MTVHHVFHRVPVKMVGTVLYPLNRLKDVDSEAYDFQKKKYEGRDDLMQARIPILDCLWNDALHFSTVDPRVLAEAIESAARRAGTTDGAPAGGVRTRWFKIPVDTLRGLEAVYFHNPPGRADDDYDFPATDFEPIDVEAFRQLATVPDFMLDYYEDEFRAGRRPLMFNRLPHVLLKGALETAGFDFVDVARF